MEKNRNWTFLIYPESAPNDWFEILQNTGLPFAVSPLHDKDFNPTGDQKNHIIIVLFVFLVLLHLIK